MNKHMKFINRQQLARRQVIDRTNIRNNIGRYKYSHFTFIIRIQRCNIIIYWKTRGLPRVF